MKAATFVMVGIPAVMVQVVAESLVSWHWVIGGVSSTTKVEAGKAPRSDALAALSCPIGSPALVGIVGVGACVCERSGGDVGI